MTHHKKRSILPTGFLKVTNKYFVLLILMSKGCCRAFVEFVDVLSINNPDFENYLGQMYPPELEIKDMTESNTSASYLDLLLSIGRDGQLHTSLYDKRDDFNFHITNFPSLSSNIFARLWRFYLKTYPIRQGLLLL